GHDAGAGTVESRGAIADAAIGACHDSIAAFVEAVQCAMLLRAAMISPLEELPVAVHPVITQLALARMPPAPLAVATQSVTMQLELTLIPSPLVPVWPVATHSMILHEVPPTM